MKSKVKGYVLEVILKDENKKISLYEMSFKGLRIQFFEDVLFMHKVKNGKILLKKNEVWHIYQELNTVYYSDNYADNLKIDEIINDLSLIFERCIKAEDIVLKLGYLN